MVMLWRVGVDGACGVRFNWHGAKKIVPPGPCGESGGEQLILIIGEHAGAFNAPQAGTETGASAGRMRLRGNQ